MYIGLNDRDPRWHDLYELRISTGEKKLLRTNTENIAAWEFDRDGALRLALRTNAVGDTEILRVDAGGLKQIYSCTVLETCGVYSFDVSNRQVYPDHQQRSAELRANWTLLNPATGNAVKVESDPEQRVDISDGKPSEVDHRLLYTDYADDTTRRYFKDKAFREGLSLAAVEAARSRDCLRGRLPG